MFYKYICLNYLIISKSIRIDSEKTNFQIIGRDFHGIKGIFHFIETARYSLLRLYRDRLLPVRIDLHPFDNHMRHFKKYYIILLII